MDDARAATVPTSHGDEPDAASLQVLLAEYAMLQATLKLSWDLTQQRTSVFFTVLSATAVAIGLVAGGRNRCAHLKRRATKRTIFVGNSSAPRLVARAAGWTIWTL